MNSPGRSWSASSCCSKRPWPGCCSMNSLTRIGQAPTPGRRQGKSRALAAYHAATGASKRLVMMGPILPWPQPLPPRAQSGQACRKPPACDDAPYLARRGSAAAGCRGCILDHMGETTHRDTKGAPGVREAAAHGDQATADLTPAPAATYWRRRLVVLAVGLTTLAVAAWSLSESLKVHAGAHSSAASRDGPREQGAGAPAGGTPGADSHAGASLQPSAS